MECPCLSPRPPRESRHLSGPTASQHGLGERWKMLCDLKVTTCVVACDSPLPAVMLGFASSHLLLSSTALRSWCHLVRRSVASVLALHVLSSRTWHRHHLRRVRYVAFASYYFLITTVERIHWCDCNPTTSSRLCLQSVSPGLCAFARGQESGVWTPESAHLFAFAAVRVLLSESNVRLSSVSRFRQHGTTVGARWDL